MASTTDYLRFSPDKLDFSDFIDGTVIIKRIFLSNISAKRIQLTIEAPKSTFFAVRNFEQVCCVSLAPGLSFSIEIEFRFALIGSFCDGRLVTVATPGASVKPLLEIESIRDQISFTAIGARPYLFSLEACPAKPKLLIDSKIDFGAILLPTLDSSKALPAKNSDRTFTKYIKIENVGPVAANINVDFDMELPLKISPANFTLPARASSDINSASHPIQTLKVEFQPISAGIFSGKIYLNACQTSNKNEDRGYKNPKRKEEVSAAVSRDLAPLDFIIVNAQALDRQIYLYQQDGSSEINDCNIDFGALYQGEIANYTAKVVNNGPAAVRWKFFDHGTDGSINTPHNPNDLSKTFIVTPASGILSPYAHTFVRFQMRTKKMQKLLGFKNEHVNGKAIDQHIQISLQMVEPLSLLAAKDAPINFSLSGSICPVEAILDTHKIDFGQVIIGDHRKQLVRLSNSSAKLPIMFCCEKMAHFKIAPYTGVVPPGQSMEIEVAFHPSQIGEFSKTLALRLFCPRYTSNLTNDTDIREPIEELNLELFGKTETKNGRRRKTADPYKPIASSDELLKKEKDRLDQHRKKYDALIADHRLTRYEKEKEKRLGKFFDDDICEIIDMKVRTHNIFGKWNKMDPTTGLTAPYPDVRQLKAELQAFESNSTSTSFSNKNNPPIEASPGDGKEKKGQETTLLTLFDALLTADNIDLQSSNFFTVNDSGMLQKIKKPFMISKYVGTSTLTPVDLANIFTPTQKLDFGEIFNHCEKSVRFSFLNSTPSKTPIAISLAMQLESAADVQDEVKIVPQSMMLPPMAIGIFTITLKTHRKPSAFRQDGPRSFESTLTYRINDQYEYCIPAIGSVKPVGVLIRGEHESSGMLKLKAIMPNDHEVMNSPKGQKTVEIVNNGGFPVWVECFSSRNTESQEGFFQINPRKLRIPAQGSSYLSIIFNAGLLSNCIDTLNVLVYDAFYRPSDSNGHFLIGDNVNLAESLTQTQLIPMFGEIGETKHAFYGYQANSKRVPIIDFGCLPKSSHHFSNIAKAAPPKRHRDYIPKNLKIRNVGRNSAFFTVQSSGKGEINFEPRCGILEPDGGILDLNIWVVPMNATQRVVREDLHINFYGSGKSLIIPVTYHCKMAKFTIIRNSCEWDSEVIVGSTEKREITIRNDSDICGKICIDLRDYDDFDIIPEKTKIYEVAKIAESDSHGVTEFPIISVRNPRIPEEEDWLSQGNYAKPADRLFVLEIQPTQYATFGLYFKPQKQCNYSFNLPLLTENVKMSPSIISVKAASIISPVKVSRANIIFKNKLIYPKQVGIMRPSVIARETLEIENVSSAPINWYASFGNNEKQLHEHEETNSGRTLIRRKTSPLIANLEIFKFDCHDGLLLPGRSRQITITFNPAQVGNYTATVPIFIEGFISQKPPIILELSGLGLEPSLAIYPPELFIPVIPVGEEIAVPLSIINHGYDKTELSYSISDDVAVLLSSTIQTKKNTSISHSKQVPDASHERKKGSLEITFPEGNILKNEGEALNLTVKFRAPASDRVAFSTHIQFHIDVIKSSVGGDVKMQKTFYLPVHGTADNSVMTLWPFWSALEHHSKTRVVAADDPENISRQTTALTGDINSSITEGQQKLYFTEDVPRRRKLLPEKIIFRSPAGIPLESDIKDHIYAHMVDILQKWIIKPFGLANNNEEFPADFVHMHGRPLLEIIYSLTEKKGVVPLPQANGESRDIESHIDSLVQYYGELLNSLKVLGASLSFIKPESLLSADEFRHWWRSKLKKSQREGNLTAANLQREEYYTKLELNFKYVSLESWIHLLMQVGKLFAIDKITIKHLRNLPGVVIRDDEQNPPPILSKHVLSHSENVLLKWASSSYHRSTGIWKKINNFEQDFRDGTVIAHVLVAYLSELQIPACMKNIVWLCDGEEDFAQNQRLLIQALNELFSSKTSESKISLSGNDKVGQIEFGNIKLGDLYDMVFLMCFLYQTLPQFIPKSKIDFSGSLHDKCSRSIEISNMSYKPIAYTLSMSATRDFVLKTKTNEDNRDLGSNSSGKTIILAPKSNTSLTVEFVARFIKAEKGLLILKSKAMALNNSSILSYQLIPLIESIEPSKIFKLELPLYQTNPEFVFMMDVDNPFLVDGKFSVVLKESKTKGSLRAGSKTAGSRVLASSIKSSSKMALDAGITAKRSTLRASLTSLNAEKNNSNHIYMNDPNPPSFYLKDVKKLTIPAKSGIKIALAIIPFDMGDMECTVHFMDPEVGEFLYRVELAVTLPAPTETLTFRTQPGIPANRTINLDSNSRIREKAIVSALENIARAAKSVAAERPVSIEESELKKHRPPNNEELKYKVIYDSPHWSGPSEIKIHPSSLISKKWQPAGYSSMETSRMDVSISFKAKDKGMYRGKMILTCTDFPDTRMIELVGHVQEKTVPTVDLHVECFSNKELIQELPISNRTSQDWVVKAMFEPANGNSVVNGPSFVSVKAGNIGTYPICFRPRVDDIGRSFIVTLMLESSGFYQQRFILHVKPVEDPESPK